MCSILWTVPTGRRIFEGRLGEKAFEEAIAWNWLCQKTREQDQGGTSWQRELTNVKMRRADRSDWVNKKTLTINFSLQEKNGWECVFYMVHPCLIKTLFPYIHWVPPPPIPLKGWVVPLGFAMGVTWASLWSNERVQTDRAFYLAADTSCYLSLGPSCR